MPYDVVISDAKVVTASVEEYEEGPGSDCGCGEEGG